MTAGGVCRTVQALELLGMKQSDVGCDGGFGVFCRKHILFHKCVGKGRAARSARYDTNAVHSKRRDITLLRRRWRCECTICCPLHFALYFVLGIASGQKVRSHRSTTTVWYKLQQACW